MMAKYRLTDTDVVVRDDNANIPANPDNSDYMEFTAWLAAGGVPAPYIPPAVPPAEILSQDLMAKFTTDDLTKIKAVVERNIQFWGLWSAMQAQKDPMVITNARFLAGWSALTLVLGAPRIDEIAAALGVKV